MKKIVLDEVIGYWPATAYWVERQLSDAGGVPVEVVIDSPGGSVLEGVAIYNLIREYAGEVTVTIRALAASMASYIALAGDRVRAYDNAVYMIHNVWSLIAGDHNELRKQADLQEELSAMLAAQYAKKTGMEPEHIRSLMDEESWFVGSQIVDAGFADELIESGVGGETSALAAQARERFAASSERFGGVEARGGVEAVAAALRGCLGGCGMTAKNEGSMKESENGPDFNPKQGETMELSKLTAEALAEANPSLAAELKAAGIEEGRRLERERLEAMEAVDPLGLDPEKFAALKKAAIENGDEAKELIVAVYEALAEAKESEKAAIAEARKKHAEDGKSLAAAMQELDPAAASGDAETDAMRYFDEAIERIKNKKTGGK